jgi:NCAIR mutase (PurE)-related protein
VNRAALEDLLQAVADGGLEISAALDRLRHYPVEEMGFARIDHHRALRRGFPEVVLCEGKSDAQAAAIIARLAARGGSLLATRAQPALYSQARELVPELEWDQEARTIFLDLGDAPRGAGEVVVVTAGTSDLPVAAEARRTLAVMGNEVEMIVDVGVAGIHRLAQVEPRLCRARVVIVVAGMEGALASVVAGLVPGPVIAVPTSVGYGASFGGIAALLGMLNSCAAGVTVVNIDNGFGAAYAASQINHLDPA